MIVEADLNSAELRVMALLAKDAPFLGALASGASPHKLTAKQIFGREVAKGEEEYTFAKSFTYRWFYTHPDRPPSLDAGQLRTYRVSVSPTALARAQAIMNQVHPAIVMWKRQQLASLKRTGFVYNVFGRYRDLGWAAKAWDQGVREHAEGAALNFPIQTTIGDIMNLATIRAHALLQPTGARLVFQCHDSLGVLCMPSEVKMVCAILREAIEAPVPELGGAIIPAELKAGDTWGTVKPVEES